MSESAQAETRSRGLGTSGLTLPAVLDRHAFALAVAGITVTAAAFLFHQLLAWQPHEDETLALFVGRYPLDQLLQVVLEERGGAPLHFVLAWIVAHLGLGLGGLRTVSALFAVASLPLVALLGLRLAGRRQALIATVVVGASWTFLFHGVYGRMYSLFLFTSALSYLALLIALDLGDRRSWSLWALAILATVATHPYGGLVLATQGAYVLVARRDRLRQALLAGAAVVVLGTPFWLTNLVLADRFGVGVGGGGERLGGPWPVARYLWRVAGDFTTGWWPLTILALVLVGLGLRRLPRQAVALLACVIGVPTLAFMLAQLGNATSPETRHLIFALPLVALATAGGILRLGRLAPFALAALLVSQVAWAWDRTPQLFEWEPDVRQTARAGASSYLAATGRPDDVLFGFEPLYLGAWERNPDFPLTVLPRADSKLALSTLQELDRPLGRGLWILDASSNNNFSPSLEIPFHTPEPRSAFEVRRFGPFLVIRTTQPTRTPARYLERAAQALQVGKSLYIGDADINLATVERARRSLAGAG